MFNVQPTLTSLMTAYNNTGLKQLRSLTRHVCHCATPDWEMLSSYRSVWVCLDMQNSLARVSCNSRTHPLRADFLISSRFLILYIGAKAFGNSKAALNCLRMSVIIYTQCDSAVGILLWAW